jgi:hypothetical protein
MQSEERIIVSDGHVGIERKREPVWRCALSDIVRIEAYKRDQTVVDLICFDIWYEADGVSWMVTAHEDLDGWEDLTARLRDLEGFDGDWFARVSQPPFAECRTRVYIRR